MCPGGLLQGGGEPREFWYPAQSVSTVWMCWLLGLLARLLRGPGKSEQTLFSVRLNRTLYMLEAWILMLGVLRKESSEKSPVYSAVGLHGGSLFLFRFFLSLSWRCWILGLPIWIVCGYGKIRLQTKHPDSTLCILWPTPCILRSKDPKPTHYMNSETHSMYPERSDVHSGILGLRFFSTPKINEFLIR